MKQTDEFCKSRSFCHFYVFHTNMKYHFYNFFYRKTRIFLSFLPGDWRNYAAVKKKENEGSDEVMATVL